MSKEVKVIDRKAADNEYLHKDFHAALCYGLQYLEEKHGPDAPREYLQQVARTFFKPLTERLKKEGLIALEEHFRAIFTLEGGEFEITRDGDSMTLTVAKCPAVSHIAQQYGMKTEHFCQTTIVINQTICADAGYTCSTKFEPGLGKCVQKFWKP